MEYNSELFDVMQIVFWAQRKEKYRYTVLEIYFIIKKIFFFKLVTRISDVTLQRIKTFSPPKIDHVAGKTSLN